MRPLKAICAAAIVALALSSTAYAGEISSPGSPCAAPGDVQAPAAVPTKAGEMGTPGIAEILSALIWLL